MRMFTVEAPVVGAITIDVDTALDVSVLGVSGAAIIRKRDGTISLITARAATTLIQHGLIATRRS